MRIPPPTPFLRHSIMEGRRIPQVETPLAGRRTPSQLPPFCPIVDPFPCRAYYGAIADWVDKIEPEA